jgi:SmpA / OmlA family
MSKKWILGLAAVALTLAACGGAEREKAQKAEERKVEWTWLQSAKQGLDAKRAQLASLEAQATEGAEPAPEIAALGKEIETAADELGQRLTAYINSDPPLVGEPLKPEQLAAIRMKASEDIVIAKEFIDLGGDYRKAIEIYEGLLRADPDNGEGKAALAEAEADRYMTEERLAAAKKGMTMDQVRAAIGTPYIRNVKEYPEKKVTAWFYPTDEGGDAAGVWFNDKKEVYQVTFAAVKAGGS